MKRINISELSQRIYSVFISEAGTTVEKSLSVDDLLKEDGFEYQYSIHEIIDQILDLQKCESMYFKPNRDNDLARGIITRIK